MKKSFTILIIAVVLILAASLTKDIIVKISIERGVELVTGLKLGIRSISVGIFKPVVHIKYIRLTNPRRFIDRTMIDMPEIYVHYDLPAIMAGNIHLPEMRLVLREFIVVKNSKGELNLDALRPVQAQKRGRTVSRRTAGRAPGIKIDRLVLSIGKVVYKDYTRPGPPDVREFNIDLNESYTDIDDLRVLTNLIVVKALTNTSIAALANFDLNGLQSTIGGTLATAHKLASGAASAAQDAVMSTGETARQGALEAAKKAQDAARQAADAVKDIFR